MKLEDEEDGGSGHSDSRFGPDGHFRHDSLPAPRHPLDEQMPTVHWKVPVAIAFLEDVSIEAQRRRHQVEVARRMRAAREAMSPLGVSVKDVVEEGRER